MKKEIKKIILFSIIFGIFLFGNISAATYCCEKLATQDAYCQNVNDESQCATGTNPITGEEYRKISAFCDSTSYCRPGTCINNQEGTCMSNTPQIVCEGNYGYWSEKSKDELPQCQLGCCLIGDQAAFVTQVSCNRMSALYGLEVDYRTDITNELECLASANPGAKGACVYTRDYVTTCEITTKEECQEKQKSSTNSDVSFHEGYLCTAQELEANCAKTQSTRCDGDDVYFVDTCGNLANIYDSSKVNDENYWTFIQEPTCGDDEGNKDSASCGDCDYYGGSMCQQKSAGEVVNVGDYLCKDLDCTDYNGYYSGSGSPSHGETWCATDSESGNEDSPGSTYYRLLCYNGEVSTEICDTTRQEICAEREDESGQFFGNCKVNVWQDCTAQTNQEDCEDENVRDCVWVEEDAGTGKNYYFTSEGLKNDESGGGACVPKYAPGFERDGSNNVVGGESCSAATSICYVKMEQGILESDYQCVENCSCLESSWADGLNNICTQLGDCGIKTNVIGRTGYEYGDIIQTEVVS